MKFARGIKRGTAIFGILALTGTLLRADKPKGSQGFQADARYSAKLGAQFAIEVISLPGSNPFPAARIVSQPDPNSPLNTLGLKVGDVITRLDGTPVTTLAELDNHYGLTLVRFIRQGTNNVEEKQVTLASNPPNSGPPLPP